MKTISFCEMRDYVEGVASCAGVTLTGSGCGAARLILEAREGKRGVKGLLDRINNGERVFSVSALRAVSGTRLGDAIRLAVSLSGRKGRVSRKARARRVDRGYGAAVFRALPKSVFLEGVGNG